MDEGICLDREARREDTDEVVDEDCRAARDLKVDVEESRADWMGAVDVNALRVVVFLISEYACDGRFGMTWGKRASIDADAKSSRGGLYTTERRKRGRKVD